VTGLVRLTPPRNVADRARFFDRVFFADEPWRPALRRVDARGWYLPIERGVGAYRLVITPQRPL
jgi:hypothetical protein